VDPSFEVCWACGTTREGVEDPTFVSADAVGPDESPLEVDLPDGENSQPEPTTSIDDLVEAYLALDLVQARFVADQLNEQGILAVPDTHDMHESLGSMSSLPRVWVRAVDLARAKAWLDAYDQKYKAEHTEPDRA